ncbi:IPT/TIG domain-containing protein, partial [Methylobacter sp. BBA5.1]|uniref:IPT/TIG domain-containing protein n=1 Tax=Methylobacter sp. BBA5.1 TaxID=1495064 RepID=UPI00055BD8BC
MYFNTMRTDSKIALSSMIDMLHREVSLHEALARIWRKHYIIPMWWFASLVLLFLASGALAQTPVSGVIAANTHWTSANSPYLLSGDVVIQNGAKLVVDPGVTVYMAANANLNVQAGSIQALGTLTDPISVLSDKTRLAQSAAPGDWKQWVFSPGTINTRLEHILFEHGTGLVINGSAPVLNYLKVNNHEGAAIAIDLKASPSGVGNEANGNDINGITVPAGDINGSIKWGLRGIPYVVDSGVVSVGVSPSITAITPDVIQQGTTTTVDITGARLTGLASAQFDNSGLTVEVLSGATDTQASLSVNAAATAAIGPAQASFLVDAGEIKVADALTVVPTQPILSSLDPSTLYLGQGMVDVMVNGTNFTSESSVQVNGGAVPTQFQSATQLKASIDTPASAGNLHVRLQTPDSVNAGQYLMSNELLLPVVPGQLLLSPSTLTAPKGSTKTITLTLPYPAAAGGVTVDLVSSVPTVGAVPSTLMIPAGQMSASFTFNAANVGNTVVTASKLGFTSGQAQISVVPPPTLKLEPTSLTLGVGRTASLTIHSSVPAGTSGLSVALSSSDSGIATVPASVVIPEGAKSATFTVTTVAIGSATIQAIATEFVSGSAAVTVRPVSLNLSANVLVAPGLTRSVPLILSDPAPAGGLVVNLTSGNSATATVPASITVPEGQTSANFTLTGVAAGMTEINATAADYQSASTAVTVESVSINIGNPSVNSITILMGTTHSYAITLSKPAPAGGVEISLASENPAIATVSPASITIAEGQTSGGINLANVTGVEIGTTTFTASSPGLNAASVPVTTIKADLAFSKAAVTVGKGLRTYYQEVYVYRKTGGSNYSPNQSLTINLVSSDAAKATVPATVTIPAGSSSVYFQVTGVDFNNGATVTIDATAEGYTSPATKLLVNTVAPVFNFNQLDTKRSPASMRDKFRLYVTVPGAAYSGNQTAAADLPIDLAIVNADPAGIVDGF